MKKTIAMICSLFLVAAGAPTALAHWDSGDTTTPGVSDHPNVDTGGVAGDVVGVAGPAVVDTGGNAAGAAGMALCDVEVGEVDGDPGPQNEGDVDENEGPGEVPDHTWDDGGQGAACHVASYAESNWNTEGCGDTTDHGEAHAAGPAGPVYVGAACDIGSQNSGSANPTAPVSVAVCVVNQVLEGTPGEFVPCLDPLTDTSGTGFASCQQDGTSDATNLGYADNSGGVLVPSKTDAQSAVGGTTDCTTVGSTTVFVFEAVDLQLASASGPATHVWTK